MNDVAPVLPYATSPLHRPSSTTSTTSSSPISSSEDGPASRNGTTNSNSSSNGGTSQPFGHIMESLGAGECARLLPERFTVAADSMIRVAGPLTYLSCIPACRVACQTSLQIRRVLCVLCDACRQQHAVPLSDGEDLAGKIKGKEGGRRACEAPHAAVCSSLRPCWVC